MCSTTTSHSFSVSAPETLFQESFSIAVRIDYLNCTDFTSTLGMYMTLYRDTQCDSLTHTHIHTHTHTHTHTYTHTHTHAHMCNTHELSLNQTCIWHIKYGLTKAN